MVWGARANGFRLIIQFSPQEKAFASLRFNGKSFSLEGRCPVTARALKTLEKSHKSTDTGMIHQHIDMLQRKSFGTLT